MSETPQETLRRFRAIHGECCHVDGVRIGPAIDAVLAEVNLVTHLYANGHGGCAKDHSSRLQEAMECWICKVEQAEAERDMLRAEVVELRVEKGEMALVLEQQDRTLIREHEQREREQPDCTCDDYAANNVCPVCRAKAEQPREEKPKPPQVEVIDLMEALKAALKKREQPREEKP